MHHFSLLIDLSVFETLRASKFSVFAILNIICSYKNLHGFLLGSSPGETWYLLIMKDGGQGCTDSSCTKVAIHKTQILCAYIYFYFNNELSRYYVI